MDCTGLSISRRQLLYGIGSLVAWSYIPRVAAAQSRDARFLAVILRGGMDGLSAVAPIGDPHYEALRAQEALSRSSLANPMPLDDFFVLNPGMPNLYRLYQAGQAAVIHAAATPYRERSHFDGQDVLESGYPGPGQVESGWLNRAVSELPRGEHINPLGLSIGTVKPLVMRGKEPTMTWAPRLSAMPDSDVEQRLLNLYAHTDPELAAALKTALDAEAIAGNKQGGQISEVGVSRLFTEPARGAARLLASPDGPRIAALSYDGWDTHLNEGSRNGRLYKLLGALDSALATLESGLAPVWQHTAICVVTEFGRTARVNGTAGTDHGTATVALLLGGAIKGGRVVADWPGLSPSSLHEGRDLRPTLDLRAVLKGMLHDHLGLSANLLSSKVFPESADVNPMSGLIA
jgi:uncharacterized protein (DUF1501 family)